MNILEKAIFLGFGLFLTAGATGRAETEKMCGSGASVSTSLKECLEPALNSDGRFVVFTGAPAAHKNELYRGWDIYRYDRASRDLESVSDNAAREADHGPSISFDGRYVAYHSYPSFVRSNKPPRVTRITVFDHDAQKREALDLPKALKEGEALFPRWTGEKHEFLFTSNSPYLPENGGGEREAFLFDHSLKSIQLVSRGLDGKPVDGSIAEPRFSRDHSSLAFLSTGWGLDGNLPVGSFDYHLYLANYSLNQVIRLDQASKGYEEDAWMVGRFAMDENGQIIVFEARRTLETEPLVGFWSDLFIYCAPEDSLQKLTGTGLEGVSHSPSLSGDGGYLAFAFRGGTGHVEGGVAVMDMNRRTLEIVFEGEADHPVLSLDGSTVAYEAIELKEVHGKVEKAGNVYVSPNPYRHP